MSSSCPPSLTMSSTLIVVHVSHSHIYTFVGDGKDERELDEMLNSVALEAPGAACTETKEAKENLIRECTLH